MLVQHGAAVNASAAGGIRPLHDAVESDQIELVRLLLSYGADPTIATYSGLTPLKLSRSKRMLQFLKGFLSDLTGEVPSEFEKSSILPWKFTSSYRNDLSNSGFDVFDGLPSDSDREEFEDFLFEHSDIPLLPTYGLRNAGSSSRSTGGKV